MVDSQPLLVAIVGRIETEKMVEMIAAGLTAAGTILLAVVAVFQDAIRRWLTRPKLELQLSPCAPDFHRTTIRHFYTVWNPQTGMPGYQQSMEIPCYYFRLRIINKGNCEAREVEVYVKDLTRHHELKGEFEDVSRFTPMNLLWSNVRQPFLPILSPKIPKLCDVAHVVPAEKRKEVGHILPDVARTYCVVALDVQVEPNSGGHLLGPGFYRLSLILAAANSSPKEYLLDIRVTGDWYEDETRMFQEGIRLHLKDM